MTNNDKSVDKNDQSVKYSDTAYLFKLWYEKGYSLNQLEKLSGIPDSTLYSRFQPFTKSLASPEETKIYSNNRPTILRGIEARLVQKLSDEQVNKRSTIGNYFYGLDKVWHEQHLISGQSTENISLSSTIIELRQDLSGLDSILNELNRNNVETDKTINVEPCPDNAQ